MLIITIRVDAPSGRAIGIKEDIAMLLERYGDTRVLSVDEIEPEQTSVFDQKGASNNAFH